MEDECFKYFDKIESMGGVVSCIEKGFFQREIAVSAHKYQKEIEDKKLIVVGVNEYVDEKVQIPILKIDQEIEEKQIRRLEKIKKERDKNKVEYTLTKLRNGIKNNENLMPYFIDCVKVYGTLGEICQVLRDEYGTYKEPIMY